MNRLNKEIDAAYDAGSKAQCAVSFALMKAENLRGDVIMLDKMSVPYWITVPDWARMIETRKREAAEAESELATFRAAFAIIKRRIEILTSARRGA